MELDLGEGVAMENGSDESSGTKARVRCESVSASGSTSGVVLDSGVGYAGGTEYEGKIRVRRIQIPYLM